MCVFSLLSFFTHCTSHSLPFLPVTLSPILSVLLCVVCTLCGRICHCACPEARAGYQVSFISICLIPESRVFTEHGARLTQQSCLPLLLLPSAAAVTSMHSHTQHLTWVLGSGCVLYTYPLRALEPRGACFVDTWCSPGAVDVRSLGELLKVVSLGLSCPNHGPDLLSCSKRSFVSFEVCFEQLHPGSSTFSQR